MLYHLPIEDNDFTIRDDYSIKITVLVTSYNHEKFIAKALESVLMQVTDFNYEIIIGDDGSSDATRAILKEYHERYQSRIRLFLPERNLGNSGNELFFKMLKIAKGNYVALLDGDDYWISPHKLNQQVAFLEQHPECAMCFHNVKVLYENENQTPWNLYSESLPNIIAIKDILKITSIQTSTIMVRNQPWLLNMDKEIFCDWYLAVEAAIQNNVGYIDEVMSVYRQHDFGDWSKMRRTDQLETAIERYDYINDHLNYLYNDLIQGEISIRSLEAALEYEKLEDKENAARHISRCLKEHSKVLEEYVPGIGQKGSHIWKLLKLRYWLYRHPFFYQIIGTIYPALIRVKLKFFKLLLIVKSAIRIVSGRSIGFIRAKPNPILEATRGSHAASTLSWFALNTDAVEVHIGAPDGPLFSRSEGSLIYASKTTGEWIYDEILIYLQDVSCGKALTLFNCLDFVQITFLPLVKRSE